MRSLLSAGSGQPMPQPAAARPHDEDSGSSSEDDNRRKRGTVKTFVLDPIPQASGFRMWMQDLYTRVSTASKRNARRTLAWIKAVEASENISPLEISSRKWDDLHTALADAVVKVASGPLKRDLLIYREQLTRRGLPLSGRAALWMVLDQFKLERGPAMCVDITALTSLEYKGDLQGFLSAWDYCLMALAKEPDPDLVHALLAQQLRKAKAMEPTFVAYDGSPEGHGNRSTRFLYGQARAEVVHKQRETTRDALLNPTARAAPAPPKGKGKNQDKDGDGKPVVCRLWAAGSCKFGDQCKCSHAAPKGKAKPRPKVDKPCYLFTEGKCTFGNRCRSSHAKPPAPDAPRVAASPARLLKTSSLMLPGTRGRSPEVEEWLLDTGTGYDICPKHQAGKPYAGDLVTLETANGMVNTKERQMVALDVLEEDSECLVLDLSVRALSVGRRCAEYGYEFSWRPWATEPVLIRPDGTSVDIQVDNFVPYVLVASGDSEQDERTTLVGRGQSFGQVVGGKHHTTGAFAVPADGGYRRQPGGMPKPAVTTAYSDFSASSQHTSPRAASGRQQVLAVARPGTRDVRQEVKAGSKPAMGHTKGIAVEDGTVVDATAFEGHGTACRGTGHGNSTGHLQEDPIDTRVAENAGAELVTPALPCTSCSSYLACPACSHLAAREMGRRKTPSSGWSSPFSGRTGGPIEMEALSGVGTSSREWTQSPGMRQEPGQRSVSAAQAQDTALCHIRSLQPVCTPQGTKGAAEAELIRVQRLPAQRSSTKHSLEAAGERQQEPVVVSPGTRGKRQQDHSGAEVQHTSAQSGVRLVDQKCKRLRYFMYARDGVSRRVDDVSSSNNRQRAWQPWQVPAPLAGTTVIALAATLSNVRAARVPTSRAPEVQKIMFPSGSGTTCLHGLLSLVSRWSYCRPDTTEHRRATETDATHALDTDQGARVTTGHPLAHTQWG